MDYTVGIESKKPLPEEVYRTRLLPNGDNIDLKIGEIQRKALKKVLGKDSPKYITWLREYKEWLKDYKISFRAYSLSLKNL